jgi:hypothetical protein
MSAFHNAFYVIHNLQNRHHFAQSLSGALVLHTDRTTGEITTPKDYRTHFIFGKFWSQKQATVRDTNAPAMVLGVKCGGNKIWKTHT